ncbi:YlbE-like family protein [Lentibacillus juripiscarius]|uniref:YlbE-like family protein n=1 Tax=Lentibacillus juripiscarius TaxID=257446 RepID=A0ABW5V3H4_9BACI
MQTSVQQFLQENPKLAHFVRFNPVWYRHLTRNPERVLELEKASKAFYGKTLPQKADKLKSHMQMVNMLMQFTDLMKD